MRPASSASSSSAKAIRKSAPQGPGGLRLSALRQAQRAPVWRLALGAGGASGKAVPQEAEGRPAGMPPARWDVAALPAANTPNPSYSDTADCLSFASVVACCNNTFVDLSFVVLQFLVDALHSTYTYLAVSWRFLYQYNYHLHHNIQQHHCEFLFRDDSYHPQLNNSYFRLYVVKLDIHHSHL